MSSDVSDIATETEHFFLDIALRNRQPEGPKATGRCLFCEEPLAPGHRWCDEHCRYDHERLTYNQRSTLMA